MTKEELIILRKIIVNRKQIENNNKKIKELESNIESISKLMGNEINCKHSKNMEIIGEMESYDKHKRLLIGKNVFKLLSYGLIGTLLINKCFFDITSFSYFIGITSALSFTASEILGYFNKQLPNFDDFDINEKRKQNAYLIEEQIQLKNRKKERIEPMEQELKKIKKDNFNLIDENHKLHSQINLDNINLNTQKYHGRCKKRS